MFAEFENYKKRSQKEKDGIYGMITGDVVATMLPIMDNLEKAKEDKEVGKILDHIRHELNCLV